MILEPGNKLLVTHRRLFEKDTPRFFVGEVLAYQEGVAKVSGYTFVRDVARTSLVRKDDVRIKLVAIASGAYIVYQLPDEVDVDSVVIDWDHRDLKLKSGSTTLMNLAELPHDGHI